MAKYLPAVGIDLGTTFCCVGYLNTDNIEIIENKDGGRTTPSWINFAEKTEIIGKTAKEKTSRFPENVIYDMKRLIGQKFDDKLLEMKETYKWPFKILSSSESTPLIEISRNGKTVQYKPQEISAILLRYLKSTAEERLDKKVTQAVITVPAHFNYHQRTATEEAAKLAELNVLKIINEPTAAALAYVHKNKVSGNILVFDLGGGTFDVSVLSVVANRISVKATAGNTQLGGRDFDNNLAKFIVSKIKELYDKDVEDDHRTMRRINHRCENVKIELTTDESTSLDLQGLLDGEDVDFEITRSDFNTINNHLFENCLDIVEHCLTDAKMVKPDIDKIVLVGGSTRIPKMQEMLKNFFGGKEMTKAINPDEAVAYGAAIQAAMFNKGDKAEVVDKIIDVTPISLGILVEGGLMYTIVPSNSPIPISKTISFFTGRDKQTEVLFEIYEGERPLVQHNTLIGTSILKLPEKPIGYPYEVTFHVNTNGILEVSAKTGKGTYTSLIIESKKPNTQTTNNIIKDAEINKEKDNKKFDVIMQWNKLTEYCTKMQGLCSYDKKGITEKEKESIKGICQDVEKWLENNKVEDGSEEESKAILHKKEEIEDLCEPICNHYGYYVKDMYLDDFHKLLIK